MSLKWSWWRFYYLYFCFSCVSMIQNSIPEKSWLIIFIAALMFAFKKPENGDD